MSASAKAFVEERHAPLLAIVEWGWLVGKRRPLSELPPEKREQIRTAYDETDWAVSDTDTDVEFLGIATTEAAAQHKADSIEGGFWVKLPVGAWLSEKAGRYTIQSHNGDSDRSLGSSPGMELIDRGELICASIKMEGLYELAKK